MTKRHLLWTSLGQFVLEKPTTLSAILKKVDESKNGVVTLNTITDGGDLSKTSLNTNEVKIYGYYAIEKTENSVENKEA